MIFFSVVIFISVQGRAVVVKRIKKQKVDITKDLLKEMMNVCIFTIIIYSIS